MSDDSTDVVLSDMTMIYISNPDKVMREIKRITRRYVVFCELHSNTLWGKIKLRFTSGYHAHNYKKLLTKHGFKDIQIVKMPADAWPGGNPQKDYGYFIKARKPKR
jgi:ubiquinone/menaquinone biosynthesis C-methylase UbiE